jgi:hypothetical protein
MLLAVRTMAALDFARWVADTLGAWRAISHLVPLLLLLASARPAGECLAQTHS